MAIFLTLASTSAPLGASLIFDQVGSYRPVLWIVLALTLAASIIAFVAKRFTSQAQRSEGIEPQNALPVEFDLSR